jgi:hypothetical protein
MPSRPLAEPFPGAMTRARRERLEALPDAVRDELEALTQTFIRYPPNDLTTLLYRYVTKHRDEIGVSADF